ncbi:MAG: hypothetical protein GC185_05995 [Alphaproteobacteria bacterium]|nr:hypothetical protein [Alphaproteobacteria bacterium]
MAVPAPVAQAANKVSGPDITKGQVDLEYRGGYDSDDLAARDRVQTHKFDLGYGVTDRWRVETIGVASGKTGNVEWGTQEAIVKYQVFKKGEWWSRLALQGDYKFALQSGKPDKLDFEILAAKDTGPFAHALNLHFENEVGEYARGATDVNFGWKTRYHLQPHFDPGVEFYGDFGKLDAAHRTAEKFQLGPAFYGKIADGFSYDVGYLFALNNNTTDGRFKFILSYAFSAL